MFYSVEFQKRGPGKRKKKKQTCSLFFFLAHAHILVTLHPDDRPQTPEQYDQFIAAELPDPKTEPELYALVTKFMIHRCCDACQKRTSDGRATRCKYSYPKPFSSRTMISESAYPLYTRPDNGRTHYMPAQRGKPAFTASNRHVVPYNPYLLWRYNCHINVEICHTARAYGYLTEYLMKGTDRATASISR